MTKPIIIAVDAMGGDNAPQKVLDGIELHHNKTENIFYNIFGNKESINSILKQSIKVKSIHYCPPTYLRMAMYLELSRPNGDVSRWEKIYERMLLLNQYFPLLVKSINQKRMLILRPNQAIVCELNDMPVKVNMNNEGGKSKAHQKLIKLAAKQIVREL